MRLTDGGGPNGGIWFSQGELEAHRAASAIEARRVETERLDAKHESAVPKADAQESNHD